MHFSCFCPENTNLPRHSTSHRQVVCRRLLGGTRPRRAWLSHLSVPGAPSEEAAPPLAPTAAAHACARAARPSAFHLRIAMGRLLSFSCWQPVQIKNTKGWRPGLQGRHFQPRWWKVDAFHGAQNLMFLLEKMTRQVSNVLVMNVRVWGRAVACTRIPSHQDACPPPLPPAAI